MARFSTRRFNLYVLLLMVVYTVLLCSLWPMLRETHDTWVRAAIAVSPAVPIGWVVVLMARRVMLADELEQRLHLISLSVATGLVGTVCMIAGFLAMAKVWHGDGSELFWIFPSLCLIYGFTRLGLKRRVTGTWDWWGC
jgi:hypothetical protein